MIFAVTDGGCDRGVAVLEKACAHAERMDVEVIGLAIDMEPLGFKYGSQCNSNDIANAGLGVLVKALERKAA
jgi:hypothetical protein